MRKHSQKLSVLLLTLLLVVVLAVGLAACDGNKNPQTPEDPTPEEHTTHTPDSTTDWHSDDTEHWHLCVEGGEPLSKAAHAFELTVNGEQKTLTCSVCGKTVDASAATLKSNDTEHWYEIEKGGKTIKTAPVAHDLALIVEGEQKSLKCSVCEKTLDASAATMNKNAEGHWYEIEKDGTTYKTASTSHSKSAKAVDKGEQHAYSCTVCQFEYAPEAHTPGTEATKIDSEKHAYTCTACDKSIEENHDLSYTPDQDGGHHAVCADCDYEGANEQCVKGEDVQYTDLEDGSNHTWQCSLCEATVTEAHNLSGYRLDADSNEHYKQCTLCRAQTDRATHTTVEKTSETQHWTECEVCEQQITAPASHTKIWKDTEDHKQHYEACTGCTRTFGEPEDHVHDGWTDNGDECGFTCTTCSLEISAPHDYTDSASCINCEHDDPKWSVKDNEDGTYTLIAFHYNTNVAEFQGTEDEPYMINLPKTYKGKPIVGLDKRGENESFFDQNRLSQKDIYGTLVIPEGYKYIGDYNLGVINASGHLTITKIYIPSTVEKVYEMFWKCQPLYIADFEKFLAIEVETSKNYTSGIYTPTEFYIKGEDGEYAKTSDIVIPEGVEEIKNSIAFIGSKLNSLTLPSTLTKIEPASGNYRDIDRLVIKTLQQALSLNVQPFFEFSTLKVKNLVIEDVGEEGLTEEFHIPESISEITAGSIFKLEEFDVVTKLYIHDGVTSLSNLGFRNVNEVHFESKSNMLHVMSDAEWSHLNNNSKAAQLKAFVGDDEVTDLVITDDMLGEGGVIKAFAYVTSLQTIKFETTQPITLEGSYNFTYNTNLKSVDFGNATLTNESYPSQWFANCTTLGGVVKLPEGPTKIASDYWFNATAVTDIILPRSLTSLDCHYGSGTRNYYPFYGTSANIIFPEDADVQDNITEGFLSRWTGTTIVLPKSIKTTASAICGTGSGSFHCAENLKRVFYQGTAGEWDELKETITADYAARLKNATALAYAKEDPGAGNNAYTWAYNEDGTLKEWYPEPECDGHDFEYESDDTQHWGQCTKCNYQLNHSNHVADPEKVGHDESQCWDVCSICEKEFGKADHTPGEELTHDAAGHQHLCTRCGEPAETSQPHIADPESYQSDGEEHWSVCQVCSEPMAHTPHVAGETYGHDETTHWSFCKDCGAKIDSSVTPHDKNGEVLGSGTAEGHHSNCSVCGEGIILVAHTYTVDDEGFADGICTLCKFSQWSVDPSTGTEIRGYSGKDIEKLLFPSIIDGKSIVGTGDVATRSWIVTENNVKSIKFPDSESFIKVGKKSFQGNTTLEEVIFSKYITTVGEYVFDGCTALRSVTFPADSQIADFPGYMFQNCSSLVDIELPNSLKTIGASAFKGCASLVEITIPDGFESFKGSSATIAAGNVFNGCTSLTTVNFPETSEKFTTFGSSAFSGCTSLKNFTVPSYITKLGAQMFNNSGIERLVISDSVTAMVNLGTTNFLKYIEIGAGITSISTAPKSPVLETVWIKGTLTKFAAIDASVPDTSEWYFSNDLASLKTLLASIPTAARVNVYAYSLEDPTGKGEDLGDKVDGYWREVDGQPKRWGNYISFNQVEFAFDLNNGVDDKTFNVSEYLRQASGEVSYKSDDVTVSGEGVVTFAKPGYFAVTAYVTGNEETCIELHFNVYSSENYLVGTVKGAETSEKQEAYTLTQGKTTNDYSITLSFNEGDKIQIAATGVTEKYGATNLTEAERDFLTTGDDGYITFTKADRYLITLTYGEEGITIDIITALYKLEIIGRQNNTAKIAEYEFKTSDDGNTQFTVLMEASKFTKNGAFVAGWPDFYIQMTLADGTVVSYKDDLHGMTVGGSAYKATKTSKYWTRSSGKGDFWYEGSVTETYKWNLYFTVASDGSIVSLYIESA